MSDRSSNPATWWLDLALVAVVVGVAGVALLTPGVPWPIEWVVGLAFLLLAPGWAVVSLVLPGSPREPDSSPRSADGGPGWIVRIALTFPLSVLVVAAVALGASATVGIRLVPLVVGVGLVTLAGLLGALLRRVSLPVGERANPLGGDLGLSPGLFGSSTLQRVTFLLALVALVSAVAFAGANPPASESFTEFYVLSETPDGDLVAADYGTDSEGERQSLYFAIENDEGQEMAYDVVAQSVGSEPGGGTERVDRFQTQVSDGERVIVQRTVPPRAFEDGSRLVVLLYKDGVPAEPSAENADLTLSLGGDGESEAAGAAAGTPTASGADE